MQTIYLDASAYKTSRDLHAALKTMLSLPDYYGMNADALNDCLPNGRNLYGSGLLPGAKEKWPVHWIFSVRSWRITAV